MHEIEVKFRVSDAAAVEAALAARGVVLSDPVAQDDQAYAEVGWEWVDSKRGRRFARLRTQEGTHSFTLKVPQSNEQSCLEYESAVADREQMHAALRAMGYRPTVRIRKSRRSGQWGEAMICLDQVEGVGAFLEAELLVEESQDAAAAQTALAVMVSDLGLKMQRVTDTYDALVHDAHLTHRTHPD